MTIRGRIERLERATPGEPNVPMRALTLRSVGDSMQDPDGREFCTLGEFEHARTEWRGQSAIVVRREVVAPGPDGEPRHVGPGPMRVTYIDGRGIDTPDGFRARILR